MVSRQVVGKQLHFELDSMELETYTRRNTYYDSKIFCVYIETKISMDERAISRQHLTILIPDTQISYLIGEMRMDLLLRDDFFWAENNKTDDLVASTF